MVAGSCTRCAKHRIVLPQYPPNDIRKLTPEIYCRLKSILFASPVEQDVSPNVEIVFGRIAWIE